MKAALTYSAVVAGGLAALLGMDAWCSHLTETNGAVRDFALTPAFGVFAILGGTVVSLAAFFALAQMLLPRPSGRMASGEGE
ncbi:hypothetical protein [Novosphingobium sp.]|uniref:hypothetical protein n=1 Tax=Novosphingobium sp. TaxID=1874826 RepID=UPI0028B1C830|nr:hypothetical protein [Novosphingobium sp.]